MDLTIPAKMPSEVHGWYIDQYKVYHKDTDFQDAFRLPALLEMLQETAWNHAHEIGVGYDQAAFKSIFWVLSRMRIEFIGKTPIWMEEILLATNPTGIDRLFALRDFMAMHKNGLPFAMVSSAWVMIDSNTRRPVRPQTIINENILKLAPPLISSGTRKLRSQENVQFGSPIIAGYRDIDGHQHVNNVRYVEWAMTAYTPEFHKTHSLSVFDINFVSEVSWGESLQCAWYESSAEPDDAHFANLYHTHIIRKELHGETAVILRLGWNHR